MIVKNAIIKSERLTYEATPSKTHEPYLPHFDISKPKRNTAADLLENEGKCKDGKIWKLLSNVISAV